MKSVFWGALPLLSLATLASAEPLESVIIRPSEDAVAQDRAAGDSEIAINSEGEIYWDDPAALAFDETRDGVADVDAALAAAQISGKHVLIVFGGNWCHDSAALVEVMQQPRTQEMLAARYEIAFVHVPYSRNERALPAAQRFGIAQVEGTPTVLILRPDGTPTNLEDAPRWRNAASRKPAAIHRALERAAPAVGE